MYAPRKSRPIARPALAAALACWLSGVAAAQQAPARPVEVMHWLTSGGESAALSVIRDAFLARGGAWRDAPVPGGSGARSAAINRILGGKPPAVFLFSLGSQLDELAGHGLVATVPGDTAAWDAVLPPMVAKASKHQGRYVAAPLAIHGENWMFFNPAVLREAGVEVPRTWPEFVEAGRKIKAAGKVPIALGGQPWQERILFNAVLLGVGGREFYLKVYGQLDPAAIQSDTMLEVFRIVSELRGFVDEGSPGRRWNQATAMLMRGQAAFQFMGDWAKGDITAAGLEPGREIGCAFAPAEETAYIMVVDAWAYTNSDDPGTRAGQRLFTEVAMDPAVQAALNQRKGSIPVRTDVAPDGFDACARHAMEVIRDPATHLVSTGLFGLPGGVSGAIDDAISQFWNDGRLTPEQGRALFRDSVLAFQ